MLSLHGRSFSFLKSNFINLKGFTLIELMVSISITSILSCIAIPNFNDFMVKIRVDNEISKLNRLLFLTRNAAINSSNIVTLCPLDNASKCTSNWQQELSVFIDNNANGIYEPSLNEQLLKIKSAIKQGDKLHYGLGRTNIMFAPTGHLSGWGKNGTFRYCPKNHQKNNRAIRLATSGRLYQSVDRDHDGIEELRTGGKIRCRS